MHSGSDPTSQERGKWMALLAALLGWMFDSSEIGAFPLVGPSALEVLPHRELPGNPTLKRRVVPRHQVGCFLLARPADLCQRNNCPRRSNPMAYVLDAIANKRCLRIERRLYENRHILSNMLFE